MSYGRGYGGGGRRFGGPPRPAPVEVGKEYEVEITEISKQGDGVARIQGFVVFVKNGKAGQKVKIKIDQVADRFAKATIVS
jgi:predicted RNA-binding protein with TRAM domain